MRASSGEFLDLAVPSVFTGIGIYFLSQLIGNLHFFLMHTTTLKCIYVFIGLMLFSIGYTYRMLIVGLAALTFFGGMFLAMAAAIWSWLVG